MEKEMVKNKIIQLPNKHNGQKLSSYTGENKNAKNPTRMIAITSGKGGVGKTNIVANLGYALSKLGKSTLILDADLGLGNLDVLLGVTSKYNLSHVITGKKKMKEIIIDGPGDMKIIPAASGIQELTQLSPQQKIKIINELNVLSNSNDILLIDTAAGISSNVTYFNTRAHEIIVVVSPDPTSITDAYALMKVLSVKYSEKHFNLVVNLAGNIQEANEIYRQLKLVTDRFLDIGLNLLGYVLFDEKVTKCVRRQKIISEQFPETRASRCIAALARKICDMSPLQPQNKF
jgi:flagellar biosynthesis protein FlhG